ncbi:MAG: hypothetical protein PUC82_04245 [bacterium]|nr:hypothetical protein [bacterium]
MKNKALIYVLLIVSIFLFNTVNVSAKEKNINYTDTKSVEITNKINISNINSFVQIMDCSGETSMLGNVNDEDSVAWLLQKALNYIRVLGPILVLVLSSLDYITALLSSNDESLAKAHKRLITRLVLAAVLFVLPTLVSVMLNVLGFTSSDTCVK